MAKHQDDEIIKSGELSYFTRTILLLLMFFVGFAILIICALWFWPLDPEWRDYCEQYYPKLSLTECREAAGG